MSDEEPESIEALMLAWRMRHRPAPLDGTLTREQARAELERIEAWTRYARAALDGGDDDLAGRVTRQTERVSAVIENLNARAEEEIRLSIIDAILSFAEAVQCDATVGRMGIQHALDIAPNMGKVLALNPAHPWPQPRPELVEAVRLYRTGARGRAVFEIRALMPPHDRREPGHDVYNDAWKALRRHREARRRRVQST